MRDQVGERRISVGEFDEVAAQTPEERLLSEVLVQLLEHGSTLRVGNAVEVLQG